MFCAPTLGFNNSPLPFIRGAELNEESVQQPESVGGNRETLSASSGRQPLRMMAPGV